MKELLQKIYTERFRWYDEYFIVGLISFVIVFIGQAIGLLLAGGSSRYCTCGFSSIAVRS